MRIPVWIINHKSLFSPCIHRALTRSKVKDNPERSVIESEGPGVQSCCQAGLSPVGASQAEQRRATAPGLPVCSSWSLIWRLRPRLGSALLASLGGGGCHQAGAQKAPEYGHVFIPSTCIPKELTAEASGSLTPPPPPCSPTHYPTTN